MSILSNYCMPRSDETTHPHPPRRRQNQKNVNEYAEPLSRCHDMFVEGAPDDRGQLTHRGFCSIFGLKQDEYTDRLVKIFDLDNSGAVGFREFVYGLSKFQVDTFERRLQFAYRLMDLDGDGSLDKFELNAAMKAALNCDRRQYNTGPPKGGGIKLPFRARPTPDNPITPGNPNDLRGEVERIALNMGATKRMGFVEFQMLVARFPQIFQPAEILYRLMNANSADAGKVAGAMSPHAMTKLMEGLGRFNVDGDSTATGFMDRSEGGPKYKQLPLTEKSGGGGGDLRGQTARGGGGGGSTSKYRLGRSSAGGRMERDAGTASTSSLLKKDEKRRKGASTSSTQGDVWSCTLCTLHNPGDLPKCKACGNARPLAFSTSTSSSWSSGLADSPNTPRSLRKTQAGDGRDKERDASTSRASVGKVANGGGGDTHLGAGKVSKSVSFRLTGDSAGEAHPSIGNEALRTFMLDLGLSTHLGSLTKAEVLSLDDLALMTDADMKEIGLLKGPRLRILDALKKGGGGGGGKPESFKCKICLDRPVQTVLKPCGHSLMCTACALSVKQCPICRQNIEEAIRWFPTW